DTVETAARFEALLNERNLGAVRPVNTGRHIYANWEFIIDKANVSPHWNVWGLPHYTGQVKYAPDMCPRTLDITARTVALDTNPFWTESEVNTLLDHLFAAAKAL
ncbi:MAG: hypothetical protein JXM69_10910, partial [Anaerolineae bacterium]|nr:hypothetical protein [Anaerolineae bacterium]